MFRHQTLAAAKEGARAGGGAAALAKQVVAAKVHPIVLHVPYAVFCTEVVYATVPGTDIGYDATAMSYAVSGTDVRNAAIAIR